ncbi:hypothetical protein BQ8482_260010 [Mesorhizobium delmotii]|uniref:Uncharacterized protein n=1 Tax=Mesorhizobium delmotii TaxID=1631247 RepID=A0A2P9AM80_9HYPH|nr:hypothetical protein BQ8482_260010 [Mesorhizobium delmotii]
MTITEGLGRQSNFLVYGSPLTRYLHLLWTAADWKVNACRAKVCSGFATTTCIKTTT